MNILLVTDSYPPEIRSASHLMHDLAVSLRERGHNVIVATTYPKYNLTNECRNKIFNEFSVEEDIDIVRVKTLPHHKVNFVIRGISQLIMPYILFLKIKKYMKYKINVIIVYSPPLPLSLVGKMFKKKYGARFFLNVQDIFPQNAIDLCILKSRLMIKFFEWVERMAYIHSDKILVHSESNKEFLMDRKEVPENRLYILNNWIDVRPYENIMSTNAIRKKYRLENKFVLLFGGVIGPSQGLELIIETARKLKKFPEIFFLFLGDGIGKQKLVNMAGKYGLRNVVFNSFVTKEEYVHVVKEADVGLVCLSSKNKTPVVPGKILDYMAASIPIVAFLNKESDGHKIIKNAKCGYSDIYDTSEKAAQIIIRIYNEKERLGQYGRNGFQYVTNHFSKKVCLDNLEKLF